MMRSKSCTIVARKRLAAGRLTVVDATNVQPEARKPLVALAREFHVLPVAIVLNLPEKSATNVIRVGPTASSALTSSETSPSNCGVRYGA
jgi:predicted kinase